jgi:glycosyltransferase involved in cell wall biosynthesis
VRTVVANRTSAAETMPRWVRIADRLFGTLGLFSRIVVNSRSVAEEHRGDPAAYRRRLVRIEHGFEPKTSALSREAARATLGLEGARILLGCVARLHPLKNLDAAIRLLPCEPDWHFAIAGQGKELAALQALARELGCADRVHFLGELSAAQIGVFLRALDVFVFPSRAETFGLAVVEAAQAGVPVVANDLPVLREVLAVGEEPCALFVNADDTAAFANAVRRLLADAPLAAALSARGMQLRKRYALDAMVDSYAALIRDTVSGEGAAGAAERIEASQT